MVQTGNRILLRRHDHPCSACFAFSDDTNFTVLYPISKLKNCRSMDEEPPPPNPQAEAEAEEEAAEEDWLQLGLGASTSSRGRETRQVAATELQLFRDRPSSSAAAGPSDASATGLSLSTPAPRASPELTVRPPQSSGEAAAAAAVARVVSPPRRQTDIWLNLQAFPDQGREGSVLPQIPSSYLRIKNGGVLTVRFLMRYIVRKLGLADEQEVEITCRDQLLLPSLTLQYVLDNIWCSGEAPSILPNSPSTDHVMTLQYRRSTSRSGPL